MLIDSVHIYIKNIGLFFTVPTVPSVEMADTLASYISNYKFQLQFNRKIETCKFQ